MILNTIFFIYISTMMPRYAFDHLNGTIGRALAALKEGRQPLKWLFLRPDDIPAYIVAFEYLRGEATKIFTSAEIIDKVSWSMRLNGMQGSDDTKCKTERHLYTIAAALMPSRKVLNRHDPEFLECLRKAEKNKSAEREIFTKHLEENWHFNTTLIDKDWYEDNPRDVFDVAFDPFELLSHFDYDEVSTRPKNPKTLYDYVAPFFIDAAKAIKHLDGRLQVEVILGDYTDVAEKIQFGLFDSEAPRPENFPAAFDRIHLSNVP
jgi:hypothetical protein